MNRKSKLINEWNDAASVISSEEHGSTIKSTAIIILIIILISLFATMPLWISLLTKSTSKKPQTQPSQTVIRDTIIIRDTVRIQQAPVTFVCHGICNGIEEFSRD